MGTVSLVLQVVRDEARLLGSVRDDVQFILDELESMTGLLRHLVVNCRGRAANDLQVRVWMKQILDFALDCRNCVKQYMQLGGGGSEGDERRRAQLRWWRYLLPQAVASRHQIATEIQKLKARAREIGERQQRYGVAVPSQMSCGDSSNGGLAQASSSSSSSTSTVAVANSRKKQGLGTLQHLVATEAFRRAVLSGPGILTDLVQWIQHLPSEAESSGSGLTVVAVRSLYGAVGSILVDQVYNYYYRQQQSSQGGKGWFDCMLRVTVQWPSIPQSVQAEMAHRMLRELQDKGYINPQPRDNGSTAGDGDAAELQNFFRGKRVLLGVSGMDYPDILPYIRGLLATLECRPGSVMVFSTNDEKVATSMRPIPTETVVFSHLNFYLKKANLNLPTDEQQFSDKELTDVLTKCDTADGDDYCTKLFLSSMHYNHPYMLEDMFRLSETLENCSNTSEKEHEMVRFCYQGLPTSYKNCLWYSTIFSRGIPHVSAATMARRWVAQGLIRPHGHVSALEESRRCLDALCMLLPPHKLGPSGTVKSFSVRPSVTSIMEKDIPTIDDLLLNNQLELNYLDLVCSIRNEFNLLVTQQGNMTDEQSTLVAKKIVMNFLTNLPTASARLLRVLYLQDYKGLDKGHLKNVCNIDELTFLSLRGTDVAELPKQIGQLKWLQTLDIRQTRIKVLKAVLPKLKHLLAGRVDCPGNDAATVKSKESFSTLRMPTGVPAGSMNELEILSHVWVSDSGKELANIGEKLKQLRKLGVVLRGGSRANIRDLFAQINGLHGTLRSLSIRMEPMGRWGAMEAVLTTPPMLLESLRICGVRDWLPSRIKELEHLAKVTLRDTLLNSEALAMLGALRGLRWLRLRYHSFDAGVLTFGSGSFPSLTDLVVEDDIVLTIAFAPGAAPKLANITWSFQRMESLFGIKNLGNLRTIIFNWLAGNGTTNNEYPQLQQEVKDHPNELIFDYKPINPTMEGQAATF